MRRTFDEQEFDQEGDEDEGRQQVVDHLLSTFVFVAFLVEFLLVEGAAHPVFFVLMVISLIDVLAGFSVSLRAAGRDVSFN